MKEPKAINSALALIILSAGVFPQDAWAERRPSRHHWIVDLGATTHARSGAVSDLQTHQTALGASGLFSNISMPAESRLGATVGLAYEKGRRHLWGARAGAGLITMGGMGGHYTEGPATALITHSENYRVGALTPTLSLYYRLAPTRKRRWSPTLGVGGAYLMAETRLSAATRDAAGAVTRQTEGVFRAEKLAPMAMAGLDYCFGRLSFGLGLNYLFLARVRDFSGPVKEMGMETRNTLFMENGFITYRPVDTSPPAGARPFEVDFGGLEILFTTRYHF